MCETFLCCNARTMFRITSRFSYLRFQILRKIHDCLYVKLVNNVISYVYNLTGIIGCNFMFCFMSKISFFLWVKNVEVIEYFIIIQ